MTSVSLTKRGLQRQHREDVLLVWLGQHENSAHVLVWELEIVCLAVHAHEPGEKLQRNDDNNIPKS